MLTRLLRVPIIIRAGRLIACAIVGCTAVGLATSAGRLFLDVPADAASRTPDATLHYAPNGNFGSNGEYLPGRLGFNVADVSTLDQLNGLDGGVKGLVWIGKCNGVDATFLGSVRPFAGNPKLFGFYLMDDPDPRPNFTAGTLAPRCAAPDLKAESDWIHGNIPGAMTFIVLMNMSSHRQPSFEGTYNPFNSHVDLFGIDPYPCRTELNGCDYDMIERYVKAADSWGVPRDQIVPVYQTFGGGKWRDDSGGQYALPTADQEREILARWGSLVKAPALDMAYSWGLQNGDLALESATDLQKVLSLHNRRP